MKRLAIGFAGWASVAVILCVGLLAVGYGLGRLAGLAPETGWAVGEGLAGAGDWVTGLPAAISVPAALGVGLAVGAALSAWYGRRGAAGGHGWATKYQDEEWIDGVLHFRTTPDGPWQPMSPAMLTERLVEAGAKAEDDAA